MKQLVYTSMIFLVIACQQKSSLVDQYPESSDLTITWIAKPGSASNQIEFQLKIENSSDTFSLGNNWDLYFNMQPVLFSTNNEESKVMIMENILGDVYRLSPTDSFPGIGTRDSYTFEYTASYGWINQSFGPRGFYFQSRSTPLVIRPVDVTYELNSDELNFDSQGQNLHPVVTPEQQYEENQKGTRESVTAVPILPTPAKWSIQKDQYTLHSNVQISYDPGLEYEAQYLSGEINMMLLDPAIPGRDTSVVQLLIDSSLTESEAYNLIVDSAGIRISASGKTGVFYGIQSFLALLPPESIQDPATYIDIAQINVSDHPYYKYRGLHLDVSRNFLGKEAVLRTLDLMARLKLNRLHFHLTNDEGWRLEIPELPELTSFGAQRGFDFPRNMLSPAYGSGPYGYESTGSGYFSKDEFVEILKYAKDRHILVIPEINGPGHARAAVLSMNHRYQQLSEKGRIDEAKEFLLSDLADTSSYTSVQNYSDNVICVCQESTYRFLELVISSIVNMYAEANAELVLFHTGGDEVPSGVWKGSPACAELISSSSEVQSIDDLESYFFKRYAAIIDRYKIPVGGWHEALLDSDHQPIQEMAGQPRVAYAWTHDNIGYELANTGFEIVICDAAHLYFDLAYSTDASEPGLFWSGFVNERTALSINPENISLPGDENLLSININNPTSLTVKGRSRILGIQGHLWSETIMNPALIDYYLLPKIYGLAERAWSGPADWATVISKDKREEEFYSEWQDFASYLGEIELPKLDYWNGGYSYRIAPPGIKIEEGKIFANSSIPLTIRYTTNGEEPTPYSDIYTAPIPIENLEEIQFRVFTSNNRASKIVHVNLKNYEKSTAIDL